MHKNIVPLIILLLTAAAAFSLDFSLRPGGFVFFPAGEGNEAAGGNERFDIGGGGELAKTTDRVIQQYITREIQPQVQNLQRQIAANPAANLYNRLAILLVRSRRTADGKAAYERAAGMGSVPAMTNLGNLALIERDYTAAERWFAQALAREPENATAKRGLEKAAAYGDIR